MSPELAAALGIIAALTAVVVAMAWPRGRITVDDGSQASTSYPTDPDRRAER